MPRRRYEILLPIRYNDGRDVEAQKLYDSREELIAMFGGLTADGIVRAGFWHDDAGTRYDDETIRLTVDVDDSAETRQMIAEFKATLLDRFQQKEIYIVSYAIDII